MKPLVVDVPGDLPIELSSNRTRGNPHKRSRLARELRETARLATIDAMHADRFALPPWGRRVRLTVTVLRGKGRKLLDQNNVPFSCKHLIDGVADALGVDDRHFAVAFAQGRDPEGGGKVVVEIEAEEEPA